MDKKSNEYFDQKDILLNVRKPKVCINIISKLLLKRRGKKDGKKSIPSVTSENKENYISPTIRKEHSRVDEAMAKVSRRIDKMTSEIYVETDLLIADLIQRAQEVENLDNELKSTLKKWDIIIYDNPKIADEMREMLKVKRKNEEPLDNVGIRLRRFAEYQKEIDKLRKRKAQSKNELKEDYKQITANYRKICVIDKQIDEIFWEFCARIDRRVAWYWQGVLIKHPFRDAIPQEPPKAQNKYIKDLLKASRDELKSRIDSIKDIYKNALKTPEI